MPALRKFKPEIKPAVLPVKQVPRRPARTKVPSPTPPTPAELKQLLTEAKLPGKVLFVIQHHSGHIRAFWYSPHGTLVCQFINTQLTTVLLVQQQLLETIRAEIKRQDVLTLFGKCPKELR